MQRFFYKFDNKRKAKNIRHKLIIKQSINKNKWQMVPLMHILFLLTCPGPQKQTHNLLKIIRILFISKITN